MTSLQTFPLEIQVRTLSFLRAVDLSKVTQTSKYFWQNKNLQNAVVEFVADHVYPTRWTEGFELQPTSKPVSVRKTRSSSLGSQEEAKRPKSRSSSLGSLEENNNTGGGGPTLVKVKTLYTFEHLQNMELLVLARALSSPEPSTGYVVSKSWCKSALLWLEGRQQHHHHNNNDTNSGKKKKKKQKKAKQRQINNASPPKPNMNSDIVCEHDQLCHSTSSRSARARRRILDKQTWKILKGLYPESSVLPSYFGECLQCKVQKLQAQKQQHDAQEVAKLKRKEPLRNPYIRKFYTRTKGMPEQCLVRHQNKDDLDRKLPARVGGDCPLVDGTYYVLSRSWCHGWRRFIKTGEGGQTPTKHIAPDAACLLCDAHRMALLPPHLESFLYGESSVLLAVAPPLVTTSITAATAQSPSQESIQAMRSLGWNEVEMARQVSAMRRIETLQQQRQSVESTPESRNEALDRENHTVVEIVTEDEFRALERCWPGTVVFGLRVIVKNGMADYDTPICRSCDATGRSTPVTIRRRVSRWDKKSKKGSEKVQRAPASLEY